MTAAGESRSAVLLAYIAVALLAAFILLGAFWYGLSADVHQRIWKDIVDRPGGPMTFRFILQPVMATIAAWRDGVNDARLGRAPYFWTVLNNPAERGGRLREGVIATARIILLGLGMDILYQNRVLGTFYPGEAAIMALLLAVIPYFLLRGPIARIARRRASGPAGD